MKIYNIIGALTMLLLISSCNEATTPPNNALDKGHEEAVRITFEFTPGSLSEPNIDEYMANKHIYADDFAPIEGKVSNIVFNTKEDGKMESKGTITLKRNTWYKINITLFNKANEPINAQFIRNEEQRNMHQFFFMPFTKADENAAKEFQRDFIDYRYGDKFSDGMLIKPPVGFEGYIKILDKAPQKFSMNTILVHLVPPSTKLSRSGKPYPYDNPQKLGSIITDINLNLEVNVIK